MEAAAEKVLARDLLAKLQREGLEIREVGGQPALGFRVEDIVSGFMAEVLIGAGLDDFAPRDQDDADDADDLRDAIRSAMSTLEAAL